MGFVEISHLCYALPDGRVLLKDASFRVGDGQKVALVGANGAGKTTLLRVVAGDTPAQSGTVTSDGELGVMRQFIGAIDDSTTVREFLLGLSPMRVREAATRLAVAEARIDDDPMRYAAALAGWGDAGGYAAEVLWDTCTTTALGLALDEAGPRLVRTLSGGEQKKLALEALLRGESSVLLLDEPDNFLDVTGKEWLEDALRTSDKTVVFVSHDRELLARTATAIVTVEGHTAWVHGGGFESYHQAREGRLDRLDELHRRHREERQRIVEQLRNYRQWASLNDKFAARKKAMETKLRHFDEREGPTERPRDQRVEMRLSGGRTGVRVVTCTGLGFRGLVEPFDSEVIFGERVAVVGPNGSGKSHFLRLLAGESIDHEGESRLGARVVSGYFNQTHDAPAWRGRTPVELLAGEGLPRGPAMAKLRRYELHEAGDQPFETLSGGQQARLQILLLEVKGANLLLLDEPTDNLDVVSAEALEDGLNGFEGTVLAATHDRWFMRGFERFLVFSDDGVVTEALEPAAL